jgi:hypothetical protein
VLNMGCNCPPLSVVVEETASTTSVLLPGPGKCGVQQIQTHETSCSKG